MEIQCNLPTARMELSMGFLGVSSKVFRRPVGRGGGAGDEHAPRPAHHAALATSACVVELKLLGRTKIVLGSVGAGGGSESSNAKDVYTSN